jgi:hypothetical protein
MIPIQQNCTNCKDLYVMKETCYADGNFSKCVIIGLIAGMIFQTIRDSMSENHLDNLFLNTMKMASASIMACGVCAFIERGSSLSRELYQLYEFVPIMQKVKELSYENIQLKKQLNEMCKNSAPVNKDSKNEPVIEPVIEHDPLVEPVMEQNPDVPIVLNDPVVLNEVHAN